MRNAIDAAPTARASAPSPSSRRGEDPGPAAPPSPVPGAPRGTRVVVVADDDARTVVVVEGRVVVEVVGETVGAVVVGMGEVEVVVEVRVEVVLGVVVVVVGELAEHVGTVMVLPSRVTAPVWAWTRPVTFAPVSSVADVRARIEPTNDVEVPSVADDPTCQKTLHA